MNTEGFYMVRAKNARGLVTPSPCVVIRENPKSFRVWNTAKGFHRIEKEKFIPKWSKK